ncbi:MAG: hypothetical protein M0R73_02390 [Dehalococcoidia bacterium]|nr:hypothetical protein [Dehalococcoidia bacterium]
MSDFLTRLAERALGRAHAVEPLLPSLWDTPTATDDLVLDDLILDGPAPAVAPTATSLDGVEAARSVPTPVALPETSTPAARRAHIAPAEAIIPPSGVPTRSVRSSPDRESAAPPPARLETPPPAPTGRDTPAIRERIEHTERIEVRTSAATPATTPRLVPTESPSPSPQSVPPLLPLAPRMVERSEVLRPIASRPEAPAPPSTVEISIGRIDVRATSKPATRPEPRRRASAPRSRQSLQDYLAAGTGQQDGGRP